jgi:hypothetical protein
MWEFVTRPNNQRMTMGEKYNMESEERNVEEVRQKLRLEAQPITVKMVGQNIVFFYPEPAEGENGG